jgi:hypothetical protein
MGAELDSDFVMPITVGDTTDRGIIAYQFDLHFDPSVIQPQATPVEVSGTLSSSLAAVYNPFNPGLLKVVVYGAYPLTGSGTLIKLRFKAVGAVGSVTQVRWSNFMFNEGNPASSPTDGQIRITSNSTPGDISFTGRENLPGTFDALNQMMRGNSFVLVSDDQVNQTSMTVSFDLISADEPNVQKVVNGNWTLMVYENGSYAGTIYGDVFDGRSTDQVNASGALTQRAFTARFRIRGGIGRYSNVVIDETPSVDYSSVTDYTNGKSTTATISYIL